MKRMNKTMAFLLCVVLMISMFCGCSKYFLCAPKITADMEYYNQKAVDNTDSLIGRSADDVEEWIYETYSEDEIKPASIINEGAYPSYLSTDETVKIFFILDGECNRFFIEPNYENDLNNRNPDFAGEVYKRKVSKYCSDINADYRKAPMINELCLYDFDKADESTNLVYYYLFCDSGGWGFQGDMPPYASIHFTYRAGTFTPDIVQQS